MKRNLLTIILSIAVVQLSMAQQVYLEQFIQPTGGTVTDTLDDGTIITLDLSTDDVEQENDEVDSYFDDDLDAGWEGAPEDNNLLTLGLRFVDLNIPNGAVIDSAFVVFHAHEGKSAEDVAMLTIVAEAADDAVTFDEDNFNEEYLLTDRPQSSAEVEWTVAEEWIIWEAYKTPDIKDLVQETVNRPGWSFGNAMALIFLPENQGPSIVENAREFTSFENIADPGDQAPDGTQGDGSNWPERRPYLQVWFQGFLSTAELSTSTFSIYPNPSDGNIQLNLKNDEVANIAVFNVAGQVVKNFVVASPSTVLDMSDLNEGLYLVQVTQGVSSTTKKLVIK